MVGYHWLEQPRVCGCGESFHCHDIRGSNRHSIKHISHMYPNQHPSQLLFFVYECIRFVSGPFGVEDVVVHIPTGNQGNVYYILVQHIYQIHLITDVDLHFSKLTYRPMLESIWVYLLLVARSAYRQTCLSMQLSCPLKGLPISWLPTRPLFIYCRLSCV